MEEKKQQKCFSVSFSSVMDGFMRRIQKQEMYFQVTALFVLPPLPYLAAIHPSILFTSRSCSVERILTTLFMVVELLLINNWVIYKMHRLRLKRVYSRVHCICVWCKAIFCLLRNSHLPSRWRCVETSLVYNNQRFGRCSLAFVFHLAKS